MVAIGELFYRDATARKDHKLHMRGTKFSLILGTIRKPSVTFVVAV